MNTKEQRDFMYRAQKAGSKILVYHSYYKTFNPNTKMLMALAW